MKARPIRVAQCIVAKIWIQLVETSRRLVSGAKTSVYISLLLLVTKNMERERGRKVGGGGGGVIRLTKSNKMKREKTERGYRVRR